MRKINRKKEKKSRITSEESGDRLACLKQSLIMEEWWNLLQ